ncbi:MAG: VOC family protein [Pseudomonadota bacterium]
MAIKALGYTIVETAKAEAWDSFLQDVVGMMKAENTADSANHYRIDDRPFRFRIENGSEEKLRAAGYEIDSRDALDALAARIGEAGQPMEWGSDADAQARTVDAFFRTNDPAGNGLEFFCGDSRDDVAFVSPAGVSGFVTGDMGMGHAVFSTPNFEETHEFYRNIVGFHDTDLPHFRFSPDPDDPGMRFAFMHADNTRHHSIALGEGPVPPSGCVHLMLEMETLVDVGRCHDRMRRAKVPESATLGKHTNDEMTGFYMETPSGFDLEIGCDGLMIDPASWKTTAHETISEWGHVWAWQEALKEAEAQEASE